MSFVHQNVAQGGLIVGSVLRGPAEISIAEPLARLVGTRAAARIIETVGATGVASMSAPELATGCDVSIRVAELVVAARSVSDALDRAPHGVVWLRALR